MTDYGNFKVPSFRLLFGLALFAAASSYPLQAQMSGGSGAARAAFDAAKAADAKKDFKEAARQYQIACDGGDMRGCNNLAVAHIAGSGVAQNVSLGESLYEKACDARFAISCSNLGYHFSDNRYSATDDARAFGFFDRACASGDFDGCYMAGVFYQNGKAGAVNVEQAIIMYQKALAIKPFDADANDNVKALQAYKLDIAGLEAHKSGLYATAAEQFQAGCDLGSASSCSNIGIYYTIGQGVPQIHSHAYSRFERALKLDPNNAIAKRGLAETAPRPPSGLVDAQTATLILNNVHPGEFGTSIDCVVLLDINIERFKSLENKLEVVSQLENRRQLHFEAAINDLYFHKMNENERKGKPVFANIGESVNNTEMQSFNKIDISHINFVISERKVNINSVLKTMEFQNWALKKSEHCLSDRELERITNVKIDLTKLKFGIQKLLEKE